MRDLKDILVEMNVDLCKADKDKMRVIILKDLDVDEITMVKTNAPTNKIREAISFKDNFIYLVDNWDCYFNCDFEIVKYYLNKKGLRFEIVKKESYWW